MTFESISKTSKRMRIFIIIIHLIIHLINATRSQFPLPTFHVHVYFNQREPNQIRTALNFRAKFLRKFDSHFDTSRPCTAEVNDYVCMWKCYDNKPSCLNLDPTGPHLVGSFGVSFLPELYNQVLPFLFEQYDLFADNLLSVMVHPLTASKGTDTPESRVRDHRLALWMGDSQVRSTDLYFLEHNKYGCTKCDREKCTQACPSEMYNISGNTDFFFE